MILDVFDTFEIILLNFLVLVYSYLIENSVNLEEVEQYILKVSEIEQLGLSKILEQRLSQYLRTNQKGKIIISITTTVCIKRKMAITFFMLYPPNQ